MGDHEAEEILEELEEEAEREVEERRLNQIWGLRLQGFNIPFPGAIDDDPRLANVRGPGQAMLNAGHGRNPVNGAQNWIPRGPRNIGGRVRGLAIHPHDDNRLYAGSATGGLFKSENGGETWFPLFHDEPSLSIAAVAVHHEAGRPAAETTIWVATGERRANAFPIAGAGVFRSTDDGANFTRVATVAELDGMEVIDAIACHPTDRDHCWVVGLRGAFRLRVQPDGTVTREQFDAGTEYSDVAFAGAAPAGPAPAGPQPHPFVLYLCRAATPRGDIVRIDDPTAAAAALNPLFVAGAASIAQPIGAGGLPALDAALPAQLAAGASTSRARITICRDTPAVAYVVYARGEGGASKYVAVFRTQQANNRPAFNAVVWNQLPEGDAALDLFIQGQVSYNLAIGVSPRNPGHLFLGMVDAFFHGNANHALPGPAPAPNWRKSVVSERFIISPDVHPDHHAFVFEQTRNPPNVYAANDGAVFLNTDYHAAGTTFFPFKVTLVPAFAITEPTFPLAPEPTHRWRRRHDGLHGSQPFDITSSPVSPALYGSGFLDNNAYFSSGGDTWRYMSFGDGAFVAWDASDPYQAIMTWQEGANAVSFGGGIQDRLPPPGFPLGRFSVTRPLDTNILESDQPRPVGDLLMHPTKPFHVLTTRQNRVYRSTNADSFTLVQVGATVELQLRVINLSGGPEIEVFGFEFERTPAAFKLGLVDSRMLLAQLDDGEGSTCRCLAANPGPWQLEDGDELRFDVHRVGLLGGTPLSRVRVVVRFTPGAGILLLGQAQPSEVAAAIGAALDAAGVIGARALPCFLNGPIGIELRTRRIGAGASIQLAGNACDVLGVSPGTYQGVPGRHASISLQVKNLNAIIANPATEIDDVDLTGRALQVGVGGGALQNVTLTDATLGSRRHPSGTMIARAIAAAAGPALDVSTVTTTKQMVLLSDTGSFTAAGTAVPQFGGDAVTIVGGLPAYPALPLRLSAWTFTDLSQVGGVDRRLTLTPPGGAAAVDIDFTAAALQDRARATAEEIAAHINAQLAAAGVAPADLRCVISSLTASGDPTEIAFAPSDPDHIWIGSSDGRVFRSVDDGQSFADVTDPMFQAGDRGVEALAVHPTDPRVAYVGLNGRGVNAAFDPGFLFRTRRAGEPGSWQHIGGPVRATDGTLLAVSAIEIDRADPRRLFIATNAGVWSSDDGGDNWGELSQGLPNVHIMDLALEPTTRTLRAALWGRGIWERHVGATPARDRRVFIRSNLQDQGRRPLLEGFDGFATFPQMSSLGQSPDIKNNPFRHPDIGADDAVVDGVEYDELITHEEPVEGASTVFVQVHNHGSFPATGVRVTALWAETVCGSPPLDAAFWTSYAAGVGAGPLVAPAPWTVIADQALPGELVAGTPRVIGLPVVWPASVGDAREIAIMVLVSAAEDPLASTETDTARLLRDQPKAAVRVTETRRLRDAQELHLAATGRGTFQVTAASTAAAALGLAPAGPTRFQRSAGGVAGAGGAGTFDVSGVPVPRTLVIDDGIGPATTVTVDGPEVPDPANATAAQLRRTINRQLREQGAFVRAIIGWTDLSIAASATEAGDRPLSLGSSALADVVVRDNAVAAADRAQLFELVTRLASPDHITRNQENRFYLRVTNRGTADQPNVRCRLYHLSFPVAAAPAHVAEVIHAPGVAAGGSDIVEMTWNPGPLAGVGAFTAVMASVDHPDNEPLALPATGFVDLDAVRAFCAGRNNAVFRVIPIT